MSHSSLGHLNTWSVLLLGGSLGRIICGLDGGSESLEDGL